MIAREHASSVVLIPALSCNSMVLPFRMYQHEIRFYRLKDQYTLDIDFFIDLLKDISGTVLILYMDYFGRQAINVELLYKFKKEYPNMVFIEDRTHNLIQERKSAFIPDYVVASLRKWINVPDGGLLWANKKLTNKYLNDDISYSETRLKAQCLRHTFLTTGNQSLKTEYRRVFSTVSDIMNSDVKPSRMSEYAYQIAQKTNWKFIRKKRAENAETLISILKGNPHIRFIQDRSCLSDLYVPFCINNRDKTQSALSSLGIFNTIVWPLSDVQKRVCPVAEYTEKHMLAAPCDQRYCVEDMIYIGNEIVRHVNE
jgi:selenocysteine lyase/cysteine desulfurase